MVEHSLSSATSAEGASTLRPTIPAAAKRKIAFMVTHSSAGGAQEIWANLAEGFAKRGYEVSLLALYPLRETVRETSADLPWNYIIDRRPSSPIGAAQLIWAMVRWIRAHRPDFILTALPAANIVAAACAKLARTGTKVILSHHSPTETHNPILDKVDGLTGSLSSVASIVSVSNAVATTLASKPAAYRNKGRVIHNALPPRIEQIIATEAAARRTGHRQGRVVVATGRLAAQKNYPLLIRASALMPDVQVKIVGNGPDEADLKTLVQDLGVDDRVTFLGHRPREEALRILAGADVFVQVSLFEGHSLALVEAARMGVPIVVSDVAVQIEGITAQDGSRCGVVVPVDDPEKLAKAILELLDNREALQRGTLSAEKLGEGATYTAMIEAYQQLMQ